MELHERIEYFRKKKGMSQMLLGVKIGASSDVVRRYEKGTADPHWKTIVKIAQALEINILALLPITARDFAEELNRREQFVNEFYGGW